jgi:diguanylate cyclase (GGDEF)-like protein/PAS domain S-box-containing protein
MTENPIDEHLIAHYQWGIIFDSIPTPIFIYDWDTQDVRCNQAMEKEFGSDAKIFLKKTCQQLQHQPGVQNNNCPYINILEDNHQVYIEENIQWQKKNYQMKITPLVDSKEKITGCIHILTDITSLSKTAELLRKSEEKYRQLFDAEADAVLLIDNETGQILEANQAAITLYGYTQDELLSMRNTDLSYEPDQTQQVTRSSPIDPDTVISVSNRLHKKKDGNVFPVDISGRFFIWHDHPVHIAAIRDITERKKAEDAMLQSQEQLKSRLDHIQSLQDKLREQAIRDPLTGLFNRRYMEETLQREMAQAKRAQENIGLIMIDLDHFKIFNDTMGHTNGDLVLQQLGKLLNRYVRQGDIACRYGGEEFLLILPGASSENTLLRAEEFRKMFETLPIEIDEVYQAYVTLSAGVATYPKDGETRDDILSNVDQALYRAKNQGRNRVVAYSPVD